MTDIERRALLGGRKAQEECTRQGIVMACPFCGNKHIRISNWGMWRCWCPECLGKSEDSLRERDAVKHWNTRQAQPVGRCGECEHWYKGHCSTGPCATEETDADFYCSNFKQDTKQGLSKQRDKEGEENATD